MEQSSRNRLIVGGASIERAVLPFRLFIQCGLVLCLTASLLFASSSPAGAVAGYGDVAGDRYFTESVQWSVDNDITGIDSACFDPDAPVSRGETAVWIWKMENQPSGFDHAFTDITDRSQEEAIAWMAETGITTGTSDTTFSPNDTLRRGQIAAFLHRLAGEPSASKDHQFTDVFSSWQQGPVSWLAQTGITTGTSDTTFSPNNTLTRAQLITFLHRYKGQPAVTVDPSTPPCTDRPAEFVTDKLLEPRQPARLADDIKGRKAAVGEKSIVVHYCGPESSRFGQVELNRWVAQFKIIEDFYVRESGGKLRLNIEAGNIVKPSNNVIDWGLTLDDWGKTQEDQCEQAIDEQEIDNVMLILADVLTGETSGYAYRSVGPGYLAMKRESGHLGTAMHEIGHILGLRHIWVSEPALCAYIKDLGRMSEKPYVEDCKGNWNLDRLPEREESYLRHSLMSYVSLADNDRKQSVRNPGSAYVACIQKFKEVKWVESCEGVLSTTPGIPENLFLKRHVEALEAQWEPPTIDGGEDINGYDVRYRVSGSSSWTGHQSVDGNADRLRIGGLRGGTKYEVAVRARNSNGPGGWAHRFEATTQREGLEIMEVIVQVGDRVHGDPRCTGPYCRWLHIELVGFGPGPHTLACAHNGVPQRGYSRGAWESTNNAQDGHNNRVCNFGFPGSEVFVVVGAEERDDSWIGGTYSAKVLWEVTEPDGVPDPPVVRATVSGTTVDASWSADDNGSRIDRWEVRGASGEFGAGRTSYTWRDLSPGGYHVWVRARNANGWSEWGISKTVTVVGVAPRAFDAGSAVGNRWDWDPNEPAHVRCQQSAVCRNVGVSNLSAFGSPPYNLECWVQGDSRAIWSGPWQGRNNSGCYFDATGTITVFVKVNGVESNRIRLEAEESEEVPDPAVRLTLGDRVPQSMGCNSVCYFLDVMPINFEPDPSSIASCWHDAGGSDTQFDRTPPNTWRQVESDPCWIEAGSWSVWVIVDGVESNRVQWNR